MHYSYGILVLVTFVLTLVIISACIYWWIGTRIDEIFNELSAETKDWCETAPDIRYRAPIELPEYPHEYSHSLATGLFDTSMAVSLANCTNRLPIPTPEPFTNQYRIVGIDPDNGQRTMYAYIFYNESSACMVFTGTFYKEEWRDNFHYQLSPAFKLRGYRKGVEVHSGFYSLYLSIRKKLWKWHHNHPEIKEIFMSGHSLGGALSTLAAFDFAEEFTSLLHYSFASPRVGNVAFSEAYDCRVNYRFRVYNTEDVIVAVPPATITGNTYQHVCSKSGTVPFTHSMGSLAKDHTEAYRHLPKCFENVARC